MQADIGNSRELAQQALNNCETNQPASNFARLMTEAKELVK